MGYIIKYGNKYASYSEESDRADYPLSEMLKKIFDYLDSIQSAFTDENGNLPNGWTGSIYWLCEEESNGLGNKLISCPFCKHKMIFHRDMHRNKYRKDIISQYYMHENIPDSECILDDLMMPFCLGAGDARPEDGFIGEYGEKWNKMLKERSGE